MRASGDRPTAVRSELFDTDGGSYSVQAHSSGNRGIRYTIRARIEREQWSVAIHPAGVEKAAKVMTGPREKAELQAHFLINKWLEKHPAPKR
jgi:hypothetical protein